MASENAELFASLLFGLESANRICISTHKSPDEDAITSSLILYTGLVKLFPDKTVRHLITGQSISKYSSLRYFDRIEFVSDVADHVDQFDALVIVDAGEYGRVTYRPEALQKAGLFTACIDHHATPPDQFTVTIQDSGLPACAQMIYEFIKPRVSLDSELARTILVGIWGDTGGLQYIRSKQLHTLDIFKQLLEQFQFDIQTLTAPFDVYEQVIFSAVSELIRNTHFETITDLPNVQISYLSREYIQKSQLTPNQISEASHRYMDAFLRKVEHHPWGLVLIPKTATRWGLSLRALPGSVNVRELVERLGIGGGHNLAAGGDFSFKNPQQDVSTFTAANLFYEFDQYCQKD